RAAFDLPADGDARPIGLHGRSLARQHEQAVVGIVAFDRYFDLGANGGRSLAELLQGQDAAAPPPGYVAEDVGAVDADDSCHFLGGLGPSGRPLATLARLAVHVLVGHTAHRFL